MIQIKEIYKTFGEVQALKNVSLEVGKGDVYGVIGYSGAGKSTLIRCINGLEKPTQGCVRVLGAEVESLKDKELRELRKEIGMIFQHFNLMGSRTIYDNIGYPLKGKKLGKQEKDTKIKALLKLVGLEDKVSAYPSQLSGGQKQRVAIARALATEPQILLCDEATSALDPMTTHSILELLKEINKNLGITIVLITHQMEVIKAICNKVAVMENGVIVEQGNVVDVFTTPSSRITKAFVNKQFHYERLSQSKEDEISKLLHLKYVGEPAGEPLISSISKQFNVTANIIFGNIEKLQDTYIGNLVIDLQGQQDQVEKAIEYIHTKQVEVEVISDECIVK